MTDRFHKRARVAPASDGNFEPARLKTAGMSAGAAIHLKDN
jgi:hypothetical protein